MISKWKCLHTRRFKKEKYYKPPQSGGWRLVGALASTWVKDSIVGVSHLNSPQLLGIVCASASAQLTFISFLTYHSQALYQSTLHNLRSWQSGVKRLSKQWVNQLILSRKLVSQLTRTSFVLTSWSKLGTTTVTDVSWILRTPAVAECTAYNAYDCILSTLLCCVWLSP